MISLDLLVQRLERLSGAVVDARPRFDVEPVPMVAPTSVEQVVALLRFAHTEKLRVIPCGLGSKLGWCGTPGHVDFMLSTRNLTRVVSHVPDDGTITIEAGMTMAELARRCRAGGHFLTPDVAAPATKTIGGVVAAGESGFDRLRFGPLRHHVLGTKVVLADGTLAKSGGQLVKNVTGFDLHRLYCGSHGTLCVIVEVSLRLFPEPEHEVWVTTSTRVAEEAFELARRALALPIRFVSLSIAQPAASQSDARFVLSARMFGRRAPVEVERRLLADAWPAFVAVADHEARAAAEAVRDSSAFASSARMLLHASCSPADVAAVHEALARALDARGISRRVSIQPGQAELDVELHEHGDAGTTAELVAAVRSELRALGATLAVRNAPRNALVALDPFGDASPGLDLMRAVQRKLDPDGVFATGRFHGGL